MTLISRCFEKTALGMLALPAVLFLCLWLKPWLGIPLALVLVLALYWSYADQTWSTDRVNVPGHALLITGGLILVWMLLSGVGGIGYQNYDYFKHNAVMHDLINQAYPVFYTPDMTTGVLQPTPLVYYVGFYLPAAVLGKVTGLTQAAFIVLFVQMLATLALATGFILTFAKAGKRAVLSVLVFLLFSGLDVLVYCYYDHALPRFGHHLEWHVRTKMQFTSTTVQLFYVPQHMSASLLGSIVGLGAWRDKALHRYLVMLGLVPLWSPFVAVGLVPLGLLLAGLQWRTLLEKMRWEKMRAAYMMLPIVLVWALFFFAKSPTVTAKTVFESWGKYLGFLAVEIGWVFPLLIVFRRYLQKSEKIICGLAVGVLAIIPLLKFPGVQDFIMRASLPMLFIIALTLIQLVNRIDFHRTGQKWLLVTTLLLMGVSWLTPASEIYKSVKKFVIRVPGHEAPARIFSLKSNETPIYLGRANSMFYTYLAPKPVVRISRSEQDVKTGKNGAKGNRK